MSTFSLNARPKRDGAYFRWEGVADRVVPPAVGGIVAVPFTHDWGPEESPTLCLSLTQFQSVYGDNTQTPGYRAVQQAFRGEDLDGIFGAGAVLAVRMVGAAGAPAVKALMNTTPAAALTLTAKYKGTRGNSLKVTVRDYAADTTKTEIILYYGATPVETYRFLDTNIADAAAQINASSDWVTAVANITGVALTTVTSSTFASGNDGGTLIAGDWTDMMTSLETSRFAVFAPFDLTDGTILASLKTWVQTMNDNRRRFLAIVGGAAGEAAATAITRSASLNSEHFVNLGIGTYKDSLLPDANGDPTVLSTSQLVPRLAGILAARGEAQAIDFARLRGVDITVGPVNQDILDAYDAGVVVLARDSDIDAPVHVETGLTTYTTTTDSTKPYSIYSNPKYVRIMGGFETELGEYAARHYIGRLPVNKTTREAIMGDAQRFLQARQDANVIQGDWSVGFPADASDNDEFIDVLVGIAFGRSLKQVFFITRVR